MVHIEEAEPLEDIIGFFAVQAEILGLGGVLGNHGPDDGQRSQQDQEWYGQSEGGNEVDEDREKASLLFFLRFLCVHPIVPSVYRVPKILF